MGPVPGRQSPDSNPARRESAGAAGTRTGGEKGAPHANRDHGGDDRAHSTLHGQGVPREPAGPAGGVDLRGAGQGRHRAPRLPQPGPHAGPPLRRAPRSGDAGGVDVPDRYRVGRLHPQVLPGAGERRRPGGCARGDRGLGAADLRLDGPVARLQGGLPRLARRQRGVLRPLPGQCPALVPGRPGTGRVHESRPRPPAGGPPPPAGRDRRRLHPRREGDGRGAGGQRSEDRRHRLGAHPLQLHRPSQHRAHPEEGVRDDLPHRDGHAGGQADLPAVLRHDGRGDGQPLRLPAQQPPGRERCHPRVRQGPGALGERLRVRGYRQVELACRRRSGRRSPGATCSGG